ncbi:MAG: hypothetical protein DRI46_12330 [Chloroflexi bacterium]|nr:MAG: hypothetical protein DRI46_12330 [Chloroflexota bacterium]
MNDYQIKCLALAKIYQDAGETGQPIQRRNCMADGFKNVIDSPTQISDLALYRVKPKEHPMEKYIDLKLDMEFTSYDTFARDSIKTIGMLTSIQKEKSGITFTCNKISSSYKCRLRPNHIHFWNRFASNPIPNNCHFRVINGDHELTNWSSSENKDTYIFSGPNARDPILAFEIKYNEDKK